MTDIISLLNPAQKEAVETTQGALLILAGPGSGKTRVITHRIAYLLNVAGISPRRILAVTFTNKAANEMKERLNILVGPMAENLTVGTFHAVCAKMLRIDGKTIDLDSDFTIYDRDDQTALIKKVMEKVGISKETIAVNATIAEISKSKSELITPAIYTQKAASFFEKQVANIYKRYQSELVSSKALDFDDIIMQTMHMLQNSETVLKKYQTRYQYVMVDEFQDTSPVQYELVKLLAGSSGNICVVGDADQSIYSWRNADIRNIVNFEKDYLQAKVVRLEQNYRSTGSILGAASAVIAQNKHRKEIKLWTQNGSGEKIVANVCLEPKEEGQYIVKEIESLVTGGKASFKDVAVMYRANAQSRAIEEAFIRYGMPYRLAAGTRFYERKEIKDIVAYMRLMQNPYDSVSLLRVINTPARGLGDKSLNDISLWAENNNILLYDALALLKSAERQVTGLSLRAVKALLSFYQMLESWRQKIDALDLVGLFDLICIDIKYKEYLQSMEDGQERWENVQELRSTLQLHIGLASETLPLVLENIALISDVDSLEEGASAVTLITLHQAKGLEFLAVFIAGVEENILPHIRSVADEGELEEERRLFYVGITRAKKYLYITRCEGRVGYSGFAINDPSRFLNDIPEQYINNKSNSKPRMVIKTPLQYRPWSHYSSSKDAADSGMKTTLNKERFAPWDAPAHYEEKYIEIEPLKQGDKVHHPIFKEGVVLSYKEKGSDAEVVVQFWGEAGQKKLLASFANLTKTGLA
ncbi:MAG: UvrD-helicase domain-containing protein [Chloroflexi bacterium]|nr:UvrD-helicase domain-containing protein [Chloroflexota bacterium]